jgi:AAA ATPase domain
MLRRVELHNFRGFAELAAELRPITVVIGPNSAGKTTLLHAIRIASQLLERVLPNSTPRVESQDGEPWIQVTSSELLLDHTELLPLVDWRSLFRDNAVGEGVFLRIRLFFDADDPIEQLTVALHCARNAQLKLAVGVRAAKALELVEGLPKQPKRLVTDRLREYLQGHMPRAVLVPSFYGVVRQEEYRTQAVVDRLLGAGDQSHIVRNLVTRLNNDEIERIDRFLNQALRTRVVRRTATSEVDRCTALDVGFRDDNGILELSAAGAGLINVIALFAALERHGNEARSRPLIYLLDEPEAHLHPRLQGEMAHWVSTLVVKQFGAQVMMATHAVEIINRLAMREDAILLRVDRSSQSATVLRGQPEIVAELESWADMTPFTAINFLASRRVLFHEGKTDARILRRCAELRFRTALRGKDRFDAWTFAELEGSGNRGMAKVLLNLIARVAPATTSTEPLRVVTVLDRDHQRAPGMSEDEAKGAVMARLLVWSRHSIESLFVTPPILAEWLRAWLDEHAPADLDERIAVALAAADRDEDLNREAQAQLQVALLRHGSRGEHEIVRAFREADQRVRDDPATWQRGKDRAQFVLRRIREGLGHAAGRQLPTDIATLLDGVDLSRFGLVEPPIPPEIRDLLDWMTAN